MSGDKKIRLGMSLSKMVRDVKKAGETYANRSSQTS